MDTWHPHWLSSLPVRNDVGLFDIRKKRTNPDGWRAIDCRRMRIENFVRGPVFRFEDAFDLLDRIMLHGSLLFLRHSSLASATVHTFCLVVG
jgi:hypothetical protein